MRLFQFIEELKAQQANLKAERGQLCDPLVVVYQEDPDVAGQEAITPDGTFNFVTWSGATAADSPVDGPDQWLEINCEDL